MDNQTNNTVVTKSEKARLRTQERIQKRLVLNMIINLLEGYARVNGFADTEEQKNKQCFGLIKVDQEWHAVTAPINLTREQSLCVVPIRFRPGEDRKNADLTEAILEVFFTEGQEETGTTNVGVINDAGIVKTVKTDGNRYFTDAYYKEK